MLLLWGRANKDRQREQESNAFSASSAAHLLSEQGMLCTRVPKERGCEGSRNKGKKEKCLRKMRRERTRGRIGPQDMA